MQQNNYTTFTPDFKGVNFNKVFLNENNSAIICKGIRVDTRSVCCSKIPHIHDYRTVKIKHNPYMGNTVILIIKKQRYKCLECKKIITSELEDVNKKCRISSTVLKEFKIHIKKMRSIKEISLTLGISYSTGYNYFDKINIDKSDKSNIKVIYMDEFKGNSNNEKYQLAIYNQDKNLVEILENRKSETIKKWIEKYSINPDMFVTDMFMQFRNAIKSYYGDMKIVADKYHVLRQSDWMLRDIRIRLFNSNVKYKELKKYWKLLSKSPTKKLSDKQKSRLKKLLDLSTDLKNIYLFRKKFYYLFSAKNEEKFKKGINKLKKDLKNSNLIEAQKLSETLENWEEEIINSYVYKIDNGFVEGKNNKIKVIKRISFGIKKFKNLEKLIHLRIS